MVEPVSDNILNLVNELYNNLDAKDKIINEQALEIARLKEKIDGAIKKLFNLKDMVYKPETREINFDIQREISTIIKILALGDKE